MFENENNQMMSFESKALRIVNLAAFAPLELTMNRMRRVEQQLSNVLTDCKIFFCSRHDSRIDRSAQPERPINIVIYRLPGKIGSFKSPFQP